MWHVPEHAEQAGHAHQHHSRQALGRLGAGSTTLHIERRGKEEERLEVGGEAVKWWRMIGICQEHPRVDRLNESIIMSEWRVCVPVRCQRRAGPRIAEGAPKCRWPPGCRRWGPA